MSLVSSAVMLPVHDHFEDLATVRRDVLGQLIDCRLDTSTFNGYDHDPRCMGECHRCGGIRGVDVGVGFMHCIYCNGSGDCPGCNLYVADQARARGLAV